MKKRAWLLFTCAMGLTLTLVASSWIENSYKPKDGFVPDERTAIAIAVAVWNPIYGEEKIASGNPYHAVLKDGIWEVTGTLHQPFFGLLGHIRHGGTAMIQISKDDGHILGVTHGK
jgi:hypothetical protein